MKNAGRRNPIYLAYGISRSIPHRSTLSAGHGLSFPAVSRARARRSDLGDAELPGGEYPGVARNQATVLAHQRRRRPAPFPAARRDRGDLGIGVGAGIFGIRDQPIDPPPLDLVGRPRTFISG